MQVAMKCVYNERIYFNDLYLELKKKTRKTHICHLCLYKDATIFIRYEHKKVMIRNRLCNHHESLSPFYYVVE